MVSPRNSMTLAFCATSSTLTPCSAFTSPASSSSHTRNVGPLHAFDVVTMEAMSASSQMSAAVNSFFQTQPCLAAFLTCSFKASTADIVAQTQEGRSSSNIDEANCVSLEDDLCDVEATVNSGDVSRNLGFLFYGGIYQGMAQNHLYNVLCPSWFGLDDSSSLALIGKEVIFDNLIFAPLPCLPVACAFKTAFTSQDLSLETFQKGLEKHLNDVTEKGLLFQCWKIWIPAQFLTFGVIPAHVRIVFVAAVSFFWMYILSTISSSGNEEQEATTKVQTAVSTEW